MGKKVPEGLNIKKVPEGLNIDQFKIKDCEENSPDNQ